jgi:subtilase family serine protease
MRHRILVAAVGAAALLVVPGSAAAASGRSHERVCGQATAGHAACFAEVVTSAQTAKPLARPRASTPSGYFPADLHSAYNLPSSGGSGQTIAIVDAYDDPTAEADLGVYRSQFALSACTTSNGCFRKVNQSGGTSPPAKNAGWAEEISLDVDMASAICPNCSILLVEASSSSLVDLGTAVNTAASLGATQISNSYGGSEYSTETSDESYYNHPGVAVTVSSGDAGYGVEFPAASRYVTAVGGTTLTQSGGSWDETAWSGAGSGCSRYVPKPSWQHDTGCTRRTVADVSAVADPATGVAVYDSTPYQGSSGWLVFGGTSVSSPIIAGVYALAGNQPLSFTYGQTGSLFDVVGGSNGSCGGSYLCTAVAGYDGPTGLGTPNGTGAY